MSRGRWCVGPCLAALLGGCGGATGPARHPPVNPAARALANAQATHEYPSPAPAPEHAPGSVTPVRALTTFAARYINWTAADVSSTMTALARASIGQARSEMSLAAAETRGDTTLRQGGIANRGVVEAVAPVREHHDEYAVVTREATVATATSAYQGLAPAWHVTLATVIDRDGRWMISGWQPES